MNTQNTKHIKKLSKKGCMVSKDALQHLNTKKVETILNLEPTPMLVNTRLIQNFEQMEAA